MGLVSVLTLALALCSGCELVFPAGGGRDAGATADAPPPPNCLERPGVFFCDGFEAPILPWKLEATGADATVDATTTAHSGNAGLRAAVTTFDSQAYAEVAIFESRMAGDLYVRAWLLAMNYITHADLIVMMGGLGLSIHAVDNELRTWNAMAKLSSGSQTLLDTGMWTCLELHVSIHPIDGVIEMYVDDTLVLETPPHPTTPPGGYERLEVGIPFATSPQGPLTVFVDDVIAGTQRIGCL